MRNSIFNGTATLDKAAKKQSYLLEKTLQFVKKVRSTSKADKMKKQYFASKNSLHQGRELVLNAFKMLLTSTRGKGIKILTPKQMLQRLPIALVRVKASSIGKFTELNPPNSKLNKKLLDKKFTEKVYSTIMNSIQI